jgi:hypothetical protein
MPVARLLSRSDSCTAGLKFGQGKVGENVDCETATAKEPPKVLPELSEKGTFMLQVPPLVTAYLGGLKTLPMSRGSYATCRVG